MEFPLEIFYNIYNWCSPQAVYSLACASPELTDLAQVRFEQQKYQIDRKVFLPDHKKSFKSSLELISTDYSTYMIGKHSVSIRYELETNRRIGYRLKTLKTIGNSNKLHMIEELVIIASKGPYLTTDWKQEQDDASTCYKSSSVGIHATKYEPSRPCDPESVAFHTDMLPFSRMNHIALY